VRDRPPAGGGEAAQPPEEVIEAALCAEEGVAIAVPREAAGCREEAGREEAVHTGDGGGAGPTETLSFLPQTTASLPLYSHTIFRILFLLIYIVKRDKRCSVF
jgi:hypothetical protein